MMEFICLSNQCRQPVKFSLGEAEKGHPIRCPSCEREYVFPPELVEKFRLLNDLIRALRKAQPILGKTSVAVDVAGHSVKIPYHLLLTNMTSQLALDFQGHGLDFNLKIKPLGEDLPIERKG